MGGAKTRFSCGCLYSEDRDDFTKLCSYHKQTDESADSAEATQAVEQSQEG